MEELDRLIRSMERLSDEERTAFLVKFRDSQPDNSLRALCTLNFAAMQLKDKLEEEGLKLAVLALTEGMRMIISGSAISRGLEGKDGKNRQAK